MKLFFTLFGVGGTITLVLYALPEQDPTAKALLFLLAAALVFTLFLAGSLPNK